MATKFNTTWLSTRQTDLPVPASTFGQNVGSAFRKGRSVNLIPLAFDAIKAKTSLGDETLLSEDQWNKSVYYRQGLEWTEGMTVERADSMARTFDIESVHANIYKRSSGFNKFSNWVSEYGTMFIADEVNFIPFLGTAYKGLSVGKAMYKAAKVGAAAGGAYGLAEGLLYKYGAAEMRGMPEPTWGLYSTDEDGNTQLGVAGMTAGGIALGGIFGAGLVGGGRALQSIFSKKKVLPDASDVRENVDTNFNLKEQLQNGPLYYKDGFAETNPTVADYGYKLKQDGSIEVEI